MISIAKRMPAQSLQNRVLSSSRGFQIKGANGDLSTLENQTKLAATATKSSSENITF